MSKSPGAARGHSILSAPNRRTRPADWPKRLRGVIARHRAAPFAWGDSDCAMLFAEAVEAMTGYNPIADGGTYTTRIGALRGLKKLGFDSVLDLVAARFVEIPPAHAMRGDLGFVAEVDPLSSPAVIDGAVAHSKRDDVGHVLVPRGHIVRAFAV